VLQAAINGARAPGEHVALPLHPADQGHAAAACRRAGAESIHAHVRDGSGRETLAPAAVHELVRALRSAVPGLPIGFSTGAWIVPEPAARLAQISSWRERPDFASVNFHEPGALEVAGALLAMGVGVEAGLVSATAAEALLASGVGLRCVRLLLEPQDEVVTDALATVGAIERVLDRARLEAPRLLHGTDATTWPLLAEAGRRGYQSRIGLEDTLWLPDGRIAEDNAALVRAAREH
jgi:uncharacterized protein (DUF849 family)